MRETQKRLADQMEDDDFDLDFLKVSSLSWFKPFFINLLKLTIFLKAILTGVFMFLLIILKI